jgi:para-nitrobenzyl esterase
MTQNTTLYILLLSLLLSMKVSAKDLAMQIVTETRQGILRGTVEENICVWRGVKYAEAERFGLPHACKAWSGVKDALEFGPAAIQTKSMLSSKEAQSEDCHYLNIWSPAADSKKRPVMVWIHGGSLVVGSGSLPMYDGLKLAKNGDVVVVSINYRLGPLGFLYFKNTIAGKDTLGNNLGLRDQIAALQWVKENIAVFGGDPAQVTIFGESAGGTSVLSLVSSPLAKGLFKAAIAQSGTPQEVWKPGLADSMTQKYFSFLRLHPDSLHLLKTLALDSLKEAQSKLLEYMLETDHKVFAPTIDGEVLSADLFSKGLQAADVPLLIGTNLDEATIFVKTMKTAPKNAKQLEEFFTRLTKDNMQPVMQAYDKYPRKSAVMQILSDAVFRIPNIRLSEQFASSAPVYMYRFEWTSFWLEVMGLGSFHGLEIPFVFGSTDRKTSRIIKAMATRKVIRAISGEMQRTWVNFARYGNPNGKGPETWKPYSPANRATMIFDKKTKLVTDPNGKQREAWVGVNYY